MRLLARMASGLQGVRLRYRYIHNAATIVRRSLAEDPEVELQHPYKSGVAVKELERSYHTSDTILDSLHIHVTTVYPVYPFCCNLF